MRRLDEDRVRPQGPDRLAERPQPLDQQSPEIQRAVLGGEVRRMGNDGGSNDPGHGGPFPSSLAITNKRGGGSAPTDKA